MGEHLPCKQGVMGSNPIISTSPEGRTANTWSAKDVKYGKKEKARETRYIEKLNGLIAQVVRARA